MRSNTYAQVWCLDFEFLAPPGHQPAPICLVARELKSGQEIRLWRDELTSTPPFPIDDNVLFVTYYGSAEWGCFLALGWPLPRHVIDLYAEYRCLRNGSPVSGWGLLDALREWNLGGITKGQKDATRDLIMSGRPWSAADRAEILDYCASDVDATAKLFGRMQWEFPHWGQSIQRGRYTTAVAWMESIGVPIDVPTLTRLRDRWDDIRLDIIRDVDAEYQVYEGTSFRAWRFGEYLRREGISWPRLDSGSLRLDSDTFRDMSRAHPKIAPLHELRQTLATMRLERLAVGPDGRNRTLLSPFGAQTGRNTPSNSRFIFGAPKWVRHLIVAPEGRKLAYIDWSSQEVAIAAALSGDRNLIAAIESGDPYLAFAKMAGLAPADATKASHPQIRDVAKVAVLGPNYGMSARALALVTGTSEVEAAALARQVRQSFPTYFAWRDGVVDNAKLLGQISTEFGWRRAVNADTAVTSVMNFPMQATGAEMLRLAAILMTRRGIKVCAPVHDAVLIEFADGDGDAVLAAQTAMTSASEVIIGSPIPVEVEVIEGRWQGKGEAMWQKVTRRGT